MFEKEAEEYAIDNYENCLYDNFPYTNDSRARQQSFKDGAEFGYNKVKEEIEKLRELVSDCLFYCKRCDSYYNDFLKEDKIFERVKKLGIDNE